MLAPTDYEITEAENGEEALVAIAKQRPDLILMDIQLPIMDGYIATSRIKADPALRSISDHRRHPPMRSVGRKRRRGRPAVTITFPSPSAHVSYWRKLSKTSRKPGIVCRSIKQQTTSQADPLPTAP
jgi:chemotaxis response regulator CheB